MSLDTTLFYALNSLAGTSDLLDAIVVFIAEDLDIILIVLALLLVLFVYDPNQKTSYFSRAEVTQRIKGLGEIVLATGVARAVVEIMKVTIHAPRPYLSLHNVTLLFPYGGYDSFPSGHASLFAALAVGLYIYNKKIGIAFGAGAVLIGITRVISGVHFPIDVLVGWLLGGLIAWSVYRLYRLLHESGTIQQWLKRLF